MDSTPSVNIKRLMFSAGLLVLLSGALLIFARDFVREVFVIPISYLIWAIGIFFRTTPQIFFWIALLVITFMIAYRSLAQKRKVMAPPPPEFFELLYQNPTNSGRVAFWRVKANLLRRGGAFYQTGFHNTLGRLLIDLLAYRYRLTPAQVEERLEDGTLEVPDDIREYALYSQNRYLGDEGSYFSRLWQEFVRWVREWAARVFKSASPVVGTREKADFSWGRKDHDPRITRILDYMKEELEVSHDDSGY